MHQIKVDFSLLSRFKFFFEINFVDKRKVFSDISYDYTIAPVIDSINSSSVLTHNVWHISDDEVKNLSKGKYRLILPYNDDPNVQ